MASRKKTTKKKTKSRVNEAGNYTKPAMRKRIFQRIKAGSKGGLQFHRKKDECGILISGLLIVRYIHKKNKKKNN